MWVSIQRNEVCSIVGLMEREKTTWINVLDWFHIGYSGKLFYGRRYIKRTMIPQNKTGIARSSKSRLYENLTTNDIKDWPFLLVSGNSIFFLEITKNTRGFKWKRWALEKFKIPKDRRQKNCRKDKENYWMWPNTLSQAEITFVGMNLLPGRPVHRKSMTL